MADSANDHYLGNGHQVQQRQAPIVTALPSLDGQGDAIPALTVTYAQKGTSIHPVPAWGMYPTELRSVPRTLIVLYKVLPLGLYQIHLELGH
ncbi:MULTISPECIES: hypothetical protein [Synechocystis]|uniref:Uncharacterized protein n=1 Tax=Synechocystis salina LEGE 00031 TaxID=1828736 RepID=A0ABR9VUQ9_9SYNC|nr:MULTISPECIES: hypothetical protein [Synechocystis]MBD2655501.1 hypothetical protein [Synechocystis sp. FACHB-383]MBE9242833.1 hypothetical protein [Synechocystis salina LEGE 00041]MBE9255100.1 hypothetical protein [Synechocystis salina LEGE 00031]